MFMKKTGPFYSSTFMPASFLVLLTALLVLSCAQDAIFHNLSMELKPVTPIIKGTPTNLVVVRHNTHGFFVYVGNSNGNTIRSFDGTDFSGITAPGGTCAGLAVGGAVGSEFLYALVHPNREVRPSSVIRRYDPATESWSNMTNETGYLLQAIHGAGGRIFAAGRRDPDSYVILRLGDDNALQPLNITGTDQLTASYRLTGAAQRSGGNIYLATAGAGVIQVNAAGTVVSPAPVAGTEDLNIAGIIATGTSIVALSNSGRSGLIHYTTNGTAFEEIPRSHDNFTGGMSVWEEYDSSWRPALLLLGIWNRGSSPNNGYIELRLDSSGNVLDPYLTSIPGDRDTQPSSVPNRSRYTASLRKHPVQAILQLPNLGTTALAKGQFNYQAEQLTYGLENWEPPIFASTSQQGLWSYRSRSGGYGWNAEDGRAFTQPDP